MVDLSSIFVNGERRNLSCFIRRASCKAPCFPGNLLQGKWWTFLGNVPGVSQCVACPLNLFFPGMMIKRRRRLLNIYAKISPESIEIFSIAEIQIIISFKFLKFGNFFCFLSCLFPASNVLSFGQNIFPVKICLETRSRILRGYLKLQCITYFNYVKSKN